MTKALLLLFFTLHYYISTVLAAQCWTPNHRDVNADVDDNDEDRYVPCNPDAEASMCCASQDVCDALTGLCFDEEHQLWWRGSCTDPSWQSDACVKLFLTESEGGKSVANRHGRHPPTWMPEAKISPDITLARCADGSWCPFANATSIQCCREGRGVFLESANTNTASSLPTATLSPRTTPIARRTISTGPAAASSRLSRGAKIGLGLGIGLGSCAVIGAIMMLFIRRRHRRIMRKIQREDAAEAGHKGPSRAMAEIDPNQAQGPVELLCPEVSNRPARNFDVSK